MPFWTRRPAPAGLPADWVARAPQLVTWFDGLIDEERAQVGALAERLLTEKRWEAARGFRLTDDIRLTIALQASLLVLGLSFDHYRKVRTIIVHPTTLVLTGEQAGPAPGLRTDAPLSVLGVADHAEGPVVIAWDEAHRNARHPERGYDVVFHEFAHKLDMLDDVVDGTPPLDTRDEHAEWVRVCTEEFEALRRGDGGHLLSPYGATNAGEFFAVATEVFFDRPRELRHHKPELYGVLSAFYRQDPASLPEP